MGFRGLFIGIIVGASLIASASCAAQVIVVEPIPIDSDAFGLGSCRSEGGTVDLRTILIGENEWIDVDRGAQRVRIRIQREQVLFEYSDKTVINEVAYGLSPESDIDIRLNFTVVNGQLAILWRETFVHRLYRQGIMRIDGDQVVPWCEGQGGTWQSH